MENEIIEKYLKAGKIAKEVREFSKSLLKEGAKYIEIASKIDEKINELGAKPAFPVNISVNEVAAHDTPSFNDERTLKKGDIVKVDIGVHVDGYIADTAYTVEIGTSNYSKLIKASEDALKSAIEILKSGIKVCEIGRAVYEKIKEHGYLPIVNLSGHLLEEYKLHAGITIPNYDNKNENTLENCAVAIEPFATNGVGQVIETRKGEIYRLINLKPVRIGRDILLYISKEFKTLPFAKRWIIQKFGKKAEIILNKFVSLDILHNYPILKEKEGGIVSQSEHTILINKEKIITTM